MSNPQPSVIEIDIADTIRRWPERKDTWLYVSVPDADTPHVDATFDADRRGFRSVPVTVTLGTATWVTALFRYLDGTWALPLKADIRKRHQLDEGDTVRLHVTIRRRAQVDARSQGRKRVVTREQPAVRRASP